VRRHWFAARRTGCGSRAGRGRLKAHWTCALGAFALLSAEAAAAERKVTTPRVEEGAWEFEARGDYTVGSSAGGDGRQTQEYEIGYGITSWWQTAVTGRLKQRPEEKLLYEATGWENVFQLTSPGKYWLDLGLYAEYSRSAKRSDPDELELKLLLEKTADPFVVTANVVFDRDLGKGAGKGVGLGYAVRAAFSWKREVQFGVEGFGEPGRLTGFRPLSAQEHILGPVILGKVDIAGTAGTLKYNVGYLFGLTKGSRKGLIKWELEYEVAF
jgi:hypothetical protein